MKTIIKILALAALVICAATTRAQEKLRRNLKEGKQQTIVVYGTSLSASRDGWPSMLERSIDSLYPGQIEVVNSAAGAMWSTWGVQNLDERVISKNPDMFIVEFTINDAFLPYKTSTEVCRLNIEYMIDRVLEANPECEVVLQVMNMPIEVHFEERPDYKAYNDVYREVARRRGLKLIDHTLYWGDILDRGEDYYKTFIPDGIHPEKMAWETLVTPYVMKNLGF